MVAGAARVAAAVVAGAAKGPRSPSLLLSLFLSLPPLALSPIPSRAYLGNPLVQEYPPDARSAGMGHAFTAVAEGPSAVWWNPGGLGLVRDWSAMLFSAEPLPYLYGEERGVRFHALSGRIRRVGVAAHFSRMAFSERPADGDTDYSEEMLLLGAGIDVAERIRRRSDRRLQWGLGAAFERNGIHASGALNPAWRKMHAWDVNVGTLARVEMPLKGIPIPPIASFASAPDSSYLAGRFGLMLRNILNQRIGPNDEPMGQRIRCGLAVETGLIAAPPSGHLVHLLATTEVEDPLKERLEANWKYGLEATLLGMVSYRYGMLDDHYHLYHGDGGVTDRNQRRVTHGFGLRLGVEGLALHFDYGRSFGNIYTLSARFAPGGR